MTTSAPPAYREAVTDAATDAALDAARGGDDDAFRTLVGPHLRALHLHCYRMLGSSTDADDALQETLTAAWRGLGGFEGRAPLRHWLYRIATTTCLRMIERRGRPPGSVLEMSWLQPYPDAPVDGLTDRDADPAAVVDRHEGVALAYIATLQLLPGRQRAVLLLREVIGLSAAETAQVLETSVASVNSALQRARATMARRTAGRGPETAPTPEPLTAGQQASLDAFLAAWRVADMPAIVKLLREDVLLMMPPASLMIPGRDAVAEFLATVPAGGRLDLVPLLVGSANGRPALGAYMPEGLGGASVLEDYVPDDGAAVEGTRKPYGVMVVDFVGDEIGAITGFPDPRLFAKFGWPDAL
jgi:RNA polymerase sigma-70 factor, ECF subfamily